MKKYIGFDIDSKKVVAAVITQGEKERYQTILLDVKKLREFLQKIRNEGDELHLTFEVCGSWGWLYDGLIDYVDELKVCNPTEMTWIYRTSKKTDRIDARKMAYLYMMGLLPTVHVPGSEVRQWRKMIQHRRDLVGKQTQAKNQIRTLLKACDYRQAPFNKNWWSKANRNWMMSLVDEIQECWSFALDDLLLQLKLYEKQVAQATERLDKILAKSVGAVILLSIPGVGPRTTEAVLAYTDDVERFRRSKEYGSYFGLTPKLDQSGAVVRQGHISKQGPSVVRWLIVESAWRVIRKCPSLMEFYERVRHGQNQRKKIAIVATARKLLTIMRSMLISGEMFNESLVLNQQQNKKVG